MRSTPNFSKPVKPIFIIGAPRSGTSITTWVLGQHPNIQPMPETSWIATLAVGSYLSFEMGSARGKFSHLSNVAFDFSPFMRRVGEAVDAIVHDCYEERCQRLYNDYRKNGRLRDGPTPESPHVFELRRAVDDPKQRWIDGTPFNTSFVWGLSEMFPDAQFIHNLRRPSDVATSLEGFGKFGHIPIELKEGLSAWASHTECAWLAERALGNKKVFRLDFERLANGPEDLVRELCGFLGEEYSPDCLIPLSHRINSSEVDDRRAQNLKKLRKLKEFRDYEALYDQVARHPASNVLDDGAMETLRSRFRDHCQAHPLT